jgi:hypothetical protein
MQTHARPSEAGDGPRIAGTDVVQSSETPRNVDLLLEGHLTDQLPSTGICARPDTSTIAQCFDRGTVVSGPMALAAIALRRGNSGQLNSREG